MAIGLIQSIIENFCGDQRKMRIHCILSYAYLSKIDSAIGERIRSGFEIIIIIVEYGRIASIKEEILNVNCADF